MAQLECSLYQNSRESVHRFFRVLESTHDIQWQWLGISSLQTESERNSESGITNGVFAATPGGTSADPDLGCHRWKQKGLQRSGGSHNGCKPWQQWTCSTDEWRNKADWDAGPRCHTGVTQWLNTSADYITFLDWVFRLRLGWGFASIGTLVKRWTFRKLNKQGIALQSALPLVSPNCRFSRLIKIPKHQLSTST